MNIFAVKDIFVDLVHITVFATGRKIPVQPDPGPWVDSPAQREPMHSKIVAAQPGLARPARTSPSKMNGSWTPNRYYICHP